MDTRSKNIVAALIALILLFPLFVTYYRANASDDVEVDLNHSSTLSRTGLEQVGAAQSDPNKLAQAVDLLTQAVQIDANDPVALFALGWGLQLQKKTDQALLNYDRAISQLNELAKFSMYNRSFIKEERGDIAGALSDVTNALSFDPAFSAAQVRAEALRAKVSPVR